MSKEKVFAVVHLWEEGPDPIYFRREEVASGYIEESLIWLADGSDDDSIDMECRAVEVNTADGVEIYDGYPPHRLHFIKSSILAPDENGALRRMVEPLSDAIIYFDNLHYDPELYPALYSDQMCLTVRPFINIVGRKGILLSVEGSDFAEVEEAYDNEEGSIIGLTLEELAG